MKYFLAFLLFSSYIAADEIKNEAYLVGDEIKNEADLESLCEIYVNMDKLHQMLFHEAPPKLSPIQKINLYRLKSLISYYVGELEEAESSANMASFLVRWHFAELYPLKEK